MASFIPYDKGYRAQVFVRGRRKSASFRTLREAKAWAASMERELGEPEPSRRTVSDLLKRYAEEVSAKKKGARPERLRIAATLRDFPDLAAMRLADVRAPDIAAWRDARARQVKASSVQRDMNWMRNAFTIGRLEWRWIDHNPFEGVRGPGATFSRDRRISPAEVKAMCRALHYRTGQAPETKVQEVALIFLIALRTAMRAGEILSLGRDTIDLQRRVARVPHKMQYLTGRPREIPLLPKAVRLLRIVSDRKQCFTITSASLDALWRKARDRLQIADLHFHDSRAEALTRLSRRVDVLTLAKISGHADIRQLMTYYRETAQDIAARLSTGIKSSPASSADPAKACASSPVRPAPGRGSPLETRL